MGRLALVVSEGQPAARVLSGTSYSDSQSAEARQPPANTLWKTHLRCFSGFARASEAVVPVLIDRRGQERMDRAIVEVGSHARDLPARVDLVGHRRIQTSE
jgi:hypothetical protein